jgi:hypothetical protein
MECVYWVTTDLGPFKTGQVVVLPESDGWVRTGWLVKLIDPPRESDLAYPHLQVQPYEDLTRA